MQIKTTGYLLPPVRIAIIRKTRNNKCWRRMCRKGNPHVPLVGMSIGAASTENNTEVPQITEGKTTIQSSNFTPGYLTKENENTN